MDSKIESLIKTMYSSISSLRNEESVVAEFLNNSENYKALIKILQTSKESRKGALGGFSIFQTCYQLEPGFENGIAKLAEAKTFNDLFRTLGLPKAELDKPNRGSFLTFLCILGCLSQGNNATYYVAQLAFDVRLFAAENFYHIDFNQDNSKSNKRC